MKKIIHLLIFIFLISITPSSHAKTDVLDKALLTGTGIAVLAGGAIMLNTTLPKVIKYYSDHPNEFEGYLQSTKKNKENIEREIKRKLSKSKSEEEYLKYKKLAETIGMYDVPPYEKHDPLEKLKTLHLPQFVQNAKDKILEHPVSEAGSPYIITSPYGKKIDTRLEFPIERPKDWDEYVLLKQASKELAENMENDVVNKKGKKPAGYAAHHIVPFSENRSFAQPYADDARDILKNVGIDLNDSENGVYLPHIKKLKNTTSESYHPEIHTQKYYEAVYKRLQLWSGNKQKIKEELSNIANELKNKTFIY